MLMMTMIVMVMMLVTMSVMVVMLVMMARDRKTRGPSWGLLGALLEPLGRLLGATRSP